jgi:isocitrate/isopropylmalate dehydrogenase
MQSKTKQTQRLGIKKKVIVKKAVKRVLNIAIRFAPNLFTIRAVTKGAANNIMSDTS